MGRSGSERTVLFTCEGIQEFTPVGDRLLLPGRRGGPNTVSSLLAYDDGEVSRILYRTVKDKGAILASEEYVLNARPHSVTTYVVDIASGCRG